MTAGAVAEIEGRKVTKKEALVAGLTGLASGALSGAISGMTGILTPKKIFEYQWLGNIAVAGIAAGLAAAGSARDRVDAALNDMVKATVTGLTFAPTVPVLESNGNTIFCLLYTSTTHYDFAIARSKKSAERFIKVVNNMDLNAARNIIFAWNDTKDMRQPEAKLYAFIQNTDKKISDDAIGALKEYEIKPALWSKKDSYISELIA